MIPLCHAPRLDRYRACLLAGAIGDALGAPVEFLTRREILRDFGPGGVRDHSASYGRVAAITDDTQMTLFTAEGLLRAERFAGAVASRADGARMTGEPPAALAAREAHVEAVAHSYLQWLLTQRERPAEHGGYDGLLGVAALHSRRAPGHTCLAALERLAAAPALAGSLRATNGSKGCGGVMRVAPAGLFCARLSGNDADAARAAFALGSDLAAITHGHPGGYLPGGVLAAMVTLLARDVPKTRALACARQILVTCPEHGDTLQAINAAERLAALGSANHDAMVQLGGGWIGDEALAMALYCTLAAESLESAVLVAVNHSGDSDSTAAIAGNLLGAERGMAAMDDTGSKAIDTAELARVFTLRGTGEPVTVTAPAIPSVLEQARQADELVAVLRERVRGLEEQRELYRQQLQAAQSAMEVLTLRLPPPAAASQSAGSGLIWAVLGLVFAVAMGVAVVVVR